MRIKNNTPCNLSVGSLLTRGSAHKNYMVVPGEAILELDDDVWLKEYAEPAAGMIKAGNLVVIKAPAKTEAEKEAEKEAELEAAFVLIKEAEAKAKAEADKKSALSGLNK
jgi:hypothetical protein